MKRLRTIVSAVAILMGAVLVVAWCGAWLLLSALNDGAVARTMAQAALSKPVVTDRIGDEISSRATVSLAGVGIDLSVIGADRALREAIIEWTGSPEFKKLVIDQVDAASQQLRVELARNDRPAGPFSVSIDVSAAVNTQVDEVPLIGPHMPDIVLAPVRVEVISSDNFVEARDAYSRLEFAQMYFLWMGIALVAVALAVSTRRRYVIAKFLIAVGAMALGLVGVLTFVAPDYLAGRLPGGDDGAWGRLALEAFQNATLPGMSKTLAIIGGGTLLAGALMMVMLKTVAAPKR